MRRRQVLAALLLPATTAGCDRPDQDGASPIPTGSSGYDWFLAGGLVNVYALTWVRKLSPTQVVTRIAGRRLGMHRWPDGGWSHLPGVEENETVVAVTRARDWALMVEDSDPIGADDVTIAALSKGTRLVTFSHNFAAADRFVLASDGTIVVDFDPGYPPDRAGTQPDLLVNAMTAVGLNPTLQQSAPAYVPPELATLALIERVTGVPLTLNLLHDSTYLAAAVVTGDGRNTTQSPKPGH
jgi:Family of unknown function (DUF6461)